MDVSNAELIRQAESKLNPHMAEDRLFGNVSSSLITSKGNSFSGVCIDTGSGTGFCAEASAIAAMVTAGEYEINKIVAVWKDDNGKLYVLPPCGRCRLFIQQMSPKNNLETDVILSNDKVVKHKDLVPYHEWPEPLEGQTT